MKIELVAHASGSSTESRTADFTAVLENLQSDSPADNIYAIKQISIWLLQKSSLAQGFVEQGCMGLVVKCLRGVDEDTPSSSNSPDTVYPAVALFHDFAKEGKKHQNAIAQAGAIPVFVEMLSSAPDSQSHLDDDAAAEAAATLSLIAVGSEEGRKEMLLAGGLPSIIQSLDPQCPLRIRKYAAAILIGLATERKERQAAILEIGGMQPLIRLLNTEPSDDEVAQTAVLNAATALRRLCDGSFATGEFCRAGGLEVVVSRIVNDEPVDRAPLRLPMPLAPSTVRAECKQLLGDVYVSTEPLYQEHISQVLQRHNITIDRITTTPTATDHSLEGKDSMERGHEVLSCRTSMPGSRIPEIKLHLKKVLRSKSVPANTVVVQTTAVAAVKSQGADASVLAKQSSKLGKLFTCLGCTASSAVEDR